MANLTPVRGVVERALYRAHRALWEASNACADDARYETARIDIEQLAQEVSRITEDICRRRV